jgi:hypothetical protein
MVMREERLTAYLRWCIHHHHQDHDIETPASGGAVVPRLRFMRILKLRTYSKQLLFHSIMDNVDI